MYSKKGILFILSISFIVLLSGCVTYTDQLSSFELKDNLLTGWMRIETNDPEWKESNVGFGLNTYLAEAWYDVIGTPMKDPSNAQYSEIIDFQTAEEGKDPAAFSSWDGPLLYGEIVWAGIIRQESNVSVISRTEEKYQVDVKLTVLDLTTGRKIYAYGSGDAVRRAGTVILELREDSMEFEDTAGYQAVRTAVRTALEKIKPYIKVQKNN